MTYKAKHDWTLITDSLREDLNALIAKSGRAPNALFNSRYGDDYLLDDFSPATVNAWLRDGSKKAKTAQLESVFFAYEAASQDPMICFSKDMQKELQEMSDLSGYNYYTLRKSSVSIPYLHEDFSSVSLQDVFIKTTKRRSRVQFNQVKQALCANALYGEDTKAETLELREHFQQVVFTLSPRECFELSEDYDAAVREMGAEPVISIPDVSPKVPIILETAKAYLAEWDTKNITPEVSDIPFQAIFAIKGTTLRMQRFHEETAREVLQYS